MCGLNGVMALDVGPFRVTPGLIEAMRDALGVSDALRDRLRAALLI